MTLHCHTFCFYGIWETVVPEVIFRARSAGVKSLVFREKDFCQKSFKVSDDSPHTRCLSTRLENHIHESFTHRHLSARLICSIRETVHLSICICGITIMHREFTAQMSKSFLNIVEAMHGEKGKSALQSVPLIQYCKFVSTIG